MKESRKWFLMALVLVTLITVIGWNIGYGKQSVDENYVNNFLNRILDKLLQSECRISGIELTFNWYAEYMWALFLHDGNSIEIGWKVFYYARNEAEIVFFVAHESGHWITRYDVFRSDDERERAANLMGIFLMSKAGYDTSCAVRMPQLILDEDVMLGIYDKEYIEETRDRIEHLSNYAGKYSGKTQKKWILLTSEDLEKIRDFCWNEYWLKYRTK